MTTRGVGERANLIGYFVLEIVRDIVDEIVARKIN